MPIPSQLLQTSADLSRRALNRGGQLDNGRRPAGPGAAAYLHVAVQMTNS